VGGAEASNYNGEDFLFRRHLDEPLESVSMRSACIPFLGNILVAVSI
jgi:hypothetical protein